MTTIGTLTAALQLDTSGYRKNLADAQQTTRRAGQQASSAGAGFGTLDRNVKQSSGGFRGLTTRLGQANPALGGSIARITSMITPVGLATAGIGAMAAAIGGSVAKITSLERELRPMIARSGLSAESLQVLTKAAERLGSEDGLEGVTDSSQELQLRMSEAAAGSDSMAERFALLGLSAQDLISKSPEEAFLQTLTAIQGLNNEADRKFAADELLGGSSEKLAGIINASSADFKALTADITANADIVGGKALANAKTFDAQWKQVTAGVGKARTAIGTALLPVLVKLFDGISKIIPPIKTALVPIFNTLADVWTNAVAPALKGVLDVVKTDLLPALKDIGAVLKPVLIPALKAIGAVAKTVVAIFGTQLKAAFEVISGVIKVVAGLLTGDFSKAWEGVKTIALGVINGMTAPLRGLGTVAGTAGYCDQRGAGDGVGGGEDRRRGRCGRPSRTGLGGWGRVAGTAGTAISGALGTAWEAVKTGGGDGVDGHQGRA